MRGVCNLAAVLVLTLSVVPAGALAQKDRRDCEQVTNPGLKVTACTQEPYTYGSLPGREDFFFARK